MEMRKIAEKQEIWYEKEEVTKSEEEKKKLLLQKFYKWIYIFGKKASERMLTKKMWDHAIEVKKIFVPSKRKMMYLLLREERGKIYEFINKQLRKEYIRLLKLP